MDHAARTRACARPPLCLVFLSGALGRGLQQVGVELTHYKDLLSPYVFTLLTGAINGGIVWAQKLRDPTVPNLPKFQ